MATGGSSPGQFSPEHEYFCRYYRLVNETGAKPLRKLLEKKAASRKMTLLLYLGTKRQKICTLVQKKIIRQVQFDMIYPTQTGFDIQQLDITLLCCIIKTVCKLSPNGSNAMEDLREARNELWHDAITEMQQSIYNTRFSKVRNVIKQLLYECGDKQFETKIEQEMNTVNSDPISFSQTVELIKTYTTQQREVCVETVNDQFEQLKTEIKHVYETVKKQPNETKDSLEKLLKTQKEAQDSMPGIHPRIETLQKQTEVILNEVSDYVDTGQFHEVEDMLLSIGNVIISGGAGEGKTYTAFEIMRRHGNGKKCLQITSPKDVSLIDPRMFEFVFLDDIFGNIELDESKFKSWFPVLEKLQQLVNAKQLKLIIATRDIVLNGCIHLLSKFPVFSKRTSLSSKKLSSAEKLEILSKALLKREIYCSHETKQMCVSAFKADQGFPYMCFLFSSNEQYFREGDSFFKRDLVMNSSIILQLLPSKQIALSFLWIKGKTKPVVLNRSEENDRILIQLADIVKYDRAMEIDSIYDDIDISLKVMDGVFVHVRADGYWFAHDSLYQSTGFYVARKGLYKEVIKYSAFYFFMRYITISERIYRTDCVFVRKCFYPDIVDRVISEVIEKHHSKEIAVHKCLSKDMLKLLIETLKEKKQLKTFLLANDRKCKSFIAYYLKTCAPNSCWFLAQVLRSIKCKRHFTQATKERECRTYQIKLHACRGACRGGNLDAFKLVQTIKFDDAVLVDIAASGNTDMYKYVKTLLNTNNADLSQRRALVKCVKKGDMKMYKAIRQSGCPVFSRCLQTAAERKNAELMKLIIDDLAKSKALKVDIFVKYTLITLFDIEVFEKILQNGVCPSKGDLLCCLKDNLKLVETVLWDTKYAVQRQTRDQTFDLRLQLWFDLIRNTFWKKKLYTMGILETSKFLENVVANGNTEKVKEIIQRLINKNDWNPDCSYSINLLNTALSTSIQLYEFLLSCGIKPNAYTLYKAVGTTDLERVKMTVAEMKKDGNFDPCSIDVKRAFSSIYEYFISEGLQPTA